MSRSDRWGYVLTAIAVLLLALGIGGALWMKATNRTPKDPPGLYCTDHGMSGEICTKETPRDRLPEPTPAPPRTSARP